MSEQILFYEGSFPAEVFWLRSFNKQIKHRRCTYEHRMFFGGLPTILSYVKQKLMGNRFFFALGDRNPVGIATLIPMRAGYFRLGGIFVLEVYRGAGTGKRFVKWICSQIDSDILVQTTNEKLRHIFLQLDFRVEKTVPLYMLVRGDMPEGLMQNG